MTSFCVRLTVGAAEDPGLEAPDALGAMGGKARSLHRLARAGLPVPPAFAVTTEVFRVLRAGGPSLPATLLEPDALARLDQAAAALEAATPPAEVAAAVEAALAELGPGDPDARYAVRSSAGLEDRPGAVAAGIFESRVGVPAAGVLQAVRAVMASALRPAAVAYAARCGLAPADLEMAVLVHPFVAGDASGTAAWDPRADTRPLIEVTAGSPPALRPGARAAVDNATRALAAAHGAVEIEWVVREDAVTFLQLRPYRARVMVPWSATAALVRLPEGDWQWDASHNPLPLSPAQAGLVALADARCRTPFHQRVVGGYLFVAPAPARGASPAADARAALEALVGAAAARAGAPPPTLEEALSRFLAVYEPLFGVVQPAARAAREALADFLAAHHSEGAALLPALIAGVASLASERAARADDIGRADDASARARAVAAYLAAFGDEAPIWDVAAPTHAEDPRALERLRRATVPPARGASAQAAAEAVRAALPPELHAEWEARLAAAREAAAVAEDDDAFYARVQADVRRALLREGERLRAAGVLVRAGEVFWLPLDDVRRHAREEESLTPRAAASAVAAAHAAYAVARADPPPLGKPAAAGDPAGLVRGSAASAGRAVGRVRLYAGSIADRAPGDDDILVARTLLPTELPLITAAALVVETGGILGHVAAQARERGIPAVVGAAGACTAFADGELVMVDGDRGVVIRL